MKQEKITSASHLLDAIGELDDALIHNCMTPYRAGKRQAVRRRALILAVSLTLAFAMLIGGFLIANRSHSSKPDDGNISPTETLGRTDLAGRLSACDSAPGVTHCNADEIDLLDANCRVVWKYREETQYRVVRLSSADMATLDRAISQSAGTPVSGGNTGSELEGIWLCHADGRVTSPCLKTSAGNTAFGTLFDYSPELEPTESFTDTLYRVITQE